MLLFYILYFIWQGVPKGKERNYVFLSFPRENWSERRRRIFHPNTFIDANFPLVLPLRSSSVAARGIEAAGNQERDAAQSFFFCIRTPEGAPSPRAPWGESQCSASRASPRATRTPRPRSPLLLLTRYAISHSRDRSIASLFPAVLGKPICTPL